MLAGAEEEDGDAGGVDHADEGADHVADGVALGDEEAVEAAVAGPEGGVEVAGLEHRVGADEGLAHHDDLVGPGQARELLERRHEPGVVVAPPGRVDEHDGEAVRARVRDRVLGHVRGVLAVPLLVQLHGTALALAQLRQVARVHPQLLDRARPERVARRDQHPVLVLQQEVAHLRQVRRLAHPVDPDDRDHVRSRPRRSRPRRRGRHRLDLAQQIERACRCQDLP